MDLSRPLKVVAPTIDADVLAVLASVDQAFTGREVHRMMGRHSQSGVNRVLNRLVQQGIVSRTRVGSSRTYELNNDHIQAEPIVQLVRARERLRERMEEAIGGWEVSPRHVSWVGSTASGNSDEDSDIDLVVVRDDDVEPDEEPWATQLIELRRDVARWTGNDCQPVEYSSAELEAALDAGDPFVLALRRTALVLWGDRADIVRSGRQKAAARRPRRG